MSGRAPDNVSDSASDHAAGGIVLWRDDARRGRIVVASCGRMRRAGITVGMSVSRAAEFCQPQPDPKSRDRSTRDQPMPPVDDGPRIEMHDPGADAEALCRLATAVGETISPMVAVEQLDPLAWAGHWRHQSESLLVDVTGVAHLFGGEASLCRAAERVCRRFGFQSRLAMADTPAVAWGMAHYGGGPIDRPILMPTGHGIAGGPIGRDDVTPMMDMPVEALRIDDATVETLARLGVTTVGQCLRLPRDGLASRLGRPLVRRMDQWTGDRHESITIADIPTAIRRRWDLQYPTGDVAIIGDRIGRLLGQIASDLSVAGRGALRIATRLDRSDQPPLMHDIGLFAPSRDVDHLSELLMHHIEGEAAGSAACSGEVVSIELSVVGSGLMRTEQNVLFDVGGIDRRGGSWRSDPAMARLIDSLATRVGRDEVVEVMPSPDPVPERSVSIRPLAGNLIAAGNLAANGRSSSSTRGGGRKQRQRRGGQQYGVGAKTTARKTSGRNSDRSRPADAQNWTDAEHRGRGFGPQKHDAMRRPLSLLKRPAALVVSGSGERNQPPQTESQIASDDLLGQVPPRIRVAGTFHRITRAWGPERIESNWWKSQPVCRDYYRVETDRGWWLWIFRDPSGRWFLHGRF